LIHIKTDPSAFTWDQITHIEKERKAQYLLETEYCGNQCAVFYGNTIHPVSKSRYFATFWTKDQHKWRDVPAFIDGSWIEDITFAAVIADNGDVIYSRHRQDYRQSDDGSVYIGGGRDYIKTNTLRTCKLTVFKGRVEYWEPENVSE